MRQLRAVFHRVPQVCRRIGISGGEKNGYEGRALPRAFLVPQSRWSGSCCRSCLTAEDARRSPAGHTGLVAKLPAGVLRCRIALLNEVAEGRRTSVPQGSLSHESEVGEMSQWPIRWCSRNRFRSPAIWVPWPTSGAGPPPTPFPIGVGSTTW